MTELLCIALGALITLDGFGLVSVIPGSSP